MCRNYFVSSFTELQHPRAGVAHREADEREYHPVSRLAGMRVCRHVGWQAYSKIASEQACVWEEILRLPCQAALEDGRAGGISMSLEFLVLFFQEKSTEEINMNGRLYDPVIARFFSPDKYVANSTFTQDFNRYSYARNNPLMYTDPSGEFAFLAPMISGIIMGVFQGAIQGAMIASQKGANGG